METKKLYRLAWGVALLWIAAGCASQRTERRITVSPVETVSPDSLSQIDIQTTIRLPKGALSKRSRLIVRPRLMQGDSLVAECPLLVLDAPIYTRKKERLEELAGYEDSLAGYATTVDNSLDLEWPYRTTLVVPEPFENGRIVAEISTSGCGRCSAIDTVDIARIANIPTLIEPAKSLQLNWMDPEFVIRPKVVKGAGEARLLFLINHSDINLALGNNRREMETMLASLEKIVSDTLATLHALDIYGMASADGSFAFNSALARSRAASAKRWLVARLGGEENLADRIGTGSRPEGWRPVLEAMRADGNPDTTAVAEILDRYGAENDDEAEYRIRRLACWPEIRAKYLQRDRKVEYEYTYTIRSFTSDDELLALYDKRPDAFNEEELLRVTTLKRQPLAKMEAYRTILHYFPQSRIAANNLAVLLLREGRTDEAEAVLDSLDSFSAEMLNTKAAAYVYRHEYERAVELLETVTSLPEARYNLGLLMAGARRLDRAYELLKGYKDTNAAIVALSVGRNDEAAAIMEACDDSSPRAAYVRALVAARYGDADAVIRHLEKAVTEERFRIRAASEPDFSICAARKDFIKLTETEDVAEK